MRRYEDLTLTVGVFFKDGTENTSQVQFKGRLLANGEEVTFANKDGAVRETEWEIYQIDDGKYLVCWFHWISAWGAPSVSDYVILDNFPVYDQTFVGTFLGDPVWDIPYHILDRAKAVLEGEEAYHPGI